MSEQKLLIVAEEKGELILAVRECQITGVHFLCYCSNRVFLHVCQREVLMFCSGMKECNKKKRSELSFID